MELRPFLVRAGCRVWRCDTGTDWLAIAIKTLAEITLETVIDNPVVTTVWIDPDACHKLAKMLVVKAMVDGTVGDVLSAFECFHSAGNR